MATSVVEMLRTLASQGRTVICTIHQPSSQIVEMFDKVLLMAEGRTAYLGDVGTANKFLETCGFPCPANYNPADHWVETLALVPGREQQSRQRLDQAQSSHLIGPATSPLIGSDHGVATTTLLCYYKSTQSPHFSGFLLRLYGKKEAYETRQNLLQMPLCRNARNALEAVCV